jgi:DNA (cytosine-5)-methyltransferase 1
MRRGSLFSGVGGWSVASDEMGWETAFMCEWDENKQYVLKTLWPKSEIYGDITKTDFKKWRGIIDILTASTPCQPFSLAGKREGSDDVRHLWPETHRAIREIQPPWFVLENVPGLVNWSKGMVFKQIISDLENEGYKVLPFLLPACGVNAPHKRERIWIVAYSCCNDASRKRNGQNCKRASSQGIGTGLRDQFGGNGTEGITPNCKKEQWNTGCESPSDNDRRDTSQYITNNGEGIWHTVRSISEIGTFANTDKEGYKRDQLRRTSKPDRTKSERECKRQSFESTSELHQTTNWLNFPTVSPLRTGDDGFSRDALRLFINENSGGLLTEKEVDQIIQKSLNKWNNETIAAGGDAIVPQVALQIFKAINEYGKL